MLDPLGLDPLLSALLMFFPAYVANFSPAFMSGLLRWKWHPIDRGRKWSDGRRVLGDGKTLEGVILGIVTGTLAGAALSLFFGQDLLLPAFLASAGAMLGDAVGSFFKRRAGVPRGGMWFPVDQLDFLAGAVALMSPVYLPGAGALLFVALVTIAFHLSLNLAGWALGLKNVPW